MLSVHYMCDGTQHGWDLQYVHTVVTNGQWPGGEEFLMFLLQTRPLRIHLTNAVNSLIHLFLTVWHWLPALYLHWTLIKLRPHVSHTRTHMQTLWCWSAQRRACLSCACSSILWQGTVMAQCSHPVRDNYRLPMSCVRAPLSPTERSIKDQRRCLQHLQWKNGVCLGMCPIVPHFLFAWQGVGDLLLRGGFSPATVYSKEANQQGPASVLLRLTVFMSCFPIH